MRSTVFVGAALVRDGRVERPAPPHRWTIPLGARPMQSGLARTAKVDQPPRASRGGIILKHGVGTPGPTRSPMLTVALPADAPDGAAASVALTAISEAEV